LRTAFIDSHINARLMKCGRRGDAPNAAADDAYA